MNEALEQRVNELEKKVAELEGRVPEQQSEKADIDGIITCIQRRLSQALHDTNEGPF